MKIVIPDDYQNAVRSLSSFRRMADQQVVIYHDHVKDRALLARRLQDADALLLIRERTPVTEELLDLLPHLKLIVQTGRNAPHIDIAACTRHNVGIVYAASGFTAYSTAELTWALILAAMRLLPQEIAQMKAGHWQTSLGTGLHGRMLGIFGYGNIGRIVAKYGLAFGMNVLVWGREGSLERAREDGLSVAASRQAFFETVDVLSMHVKLIAETRSLVTASDLARMKPDALFVNTSRAALVEPDALVNALRAGRPGHAAVDVYEEEPVIDHPLLHLDNVICTPHIGYVEKDCYEQLFGAAFDQLLAFAAGEPVAFSNL